MADMDSEHGEDADDREDDVEEEGLICAHDELPLVANLSNREEDWRTIAEILRKPRLMDCHTQIFGEEFMRMPADTIHTMNGVSKCWRTVAPGCDSLLTDETEGGSWAFCEQCVAQIPKHIQEILYFFHRLKTQLTDYRGFAMKSSTVAFARSHANKTEVPYLIWSRPAEKQRAPLSRTDDDEVDMNQIMSQRRKNAKGDLRTRIDPIKIRLGKTGAFFKTEGREEVLTFSVLVVTWARNFDMLGYINESFLRPPKNPGQASDHEALSMIWKRMQRFVAFDNLGLDETQLGKPEDYSHQPAGALGVDSLFNLFQIPLQIRGIIRQTVLERTRGRDRRARLADIKVSDIRIVGLPHLQFKRTDDEFSDYVHYMQYYLDNLSNERAGWAQNLAVLNAPKDKDNKEAAEALAAHLDNPGAWPLERDDKCEYVRFGLPRLPIWLNFSPETQTATANQELWFASLGGADGLPELTKMCLRSFLVRSTDLSSWTHFLLDYRQANSSLVLQTYYGPQSDPLAGVTTSGSLRTWWVSMQKDLSCFRAAGGSVAEASARFSRFLESAVQQHISSIRADNYRSDRLTQALDIVERLDFHAVAHSTDDSIGPVMSRICEGMPAWCEFNQYQRANEAFYKGFEWLNRSYMMNSSNLEFMIEVLISQIMWNMGEHNETTMSFFQGIHVMAGNGHFKMTTRAEGTFTVAFKPNTTGMDWVLGIIIASYQMVLDRAGFAEARLNLQAPANITNWTPVSLQTCTCASIVDNVVESLPDRQTSHQSVMATELRRADTDSIIKYAFKRASFQRHVNLNTCDKRNDNLRQALNRQKVNDLQFCGMSSNEKKADDERIKTLGVVMHRMVPGSGPHVKRLKVGGFNQSTSDGFSGRQNKLENKDAVINLVMYTHVFSVVLPALFNRSSVLPYEINPCVLALLDWASYWVKDHTGRVFEPIVYESYKRIRDGYEARQVTKALWTTSMMVIPETESKEQALCRIAQIMHCNALPVSEAIPAVHNLLTRGVHMGCLLMMAVMAKHLNVPVISLEQLKRFFTLPQVI